MDFRQKAKELVAQMTLAEKVSLCSGKNFWYLKGIDRLGLPEIMLTDGPHGLRKQEASADNLGLNKSVPAVCFPTASASACSFDRELLYELGQAIGEECRQEHVSVILGPGMNIKRSPLCGRNFEYFSEDPLLSGEMASALTEGIQSQKVGVSLKHFAVNNQEKRRMTSESVLDERTFREIYLKGFEIAVKKARPWTVMCSYNRLFGEFASQNERLLTRILRNEWGFDGLAVSDWGATVERVKAIQAGLDLEMPHMDDTNDDRLLQAVEDGTLELDKLDAVAARVTGLILRSGEREIWKYDVEKHHALARRVAAQSAVLLKNKAGILPGKTTDRVAVIGAFAKEPRFQGTGSSKITPVKLDNPYDELKALGLETEYAAGYRMDSDLVDNALIQEACRVATGKDIVYLFAGLPDRYESEAFDRDHMAMPANHNELIKAVCQVNSHVVVILQSGSPMDLPWADHVQAILLMYLAGEAGGGACADLLLGNANPSGKLAESWPYLLADNPSYGNFPGYPLTVEYREGLFVGYRYYDTAHKNVRYPFGYGLSYTQFEYRDFNLSARKIDDSDSLTVACSVKNTGKLAGREIVQLYISSKGSVIIRPEQELKGFQRVALEPGEEKQINFTLSGQDFAYYNAGVASWHVESGDYEIRIGASSRDIRLAEVVHVNNTVNMALPDLQTIAPCYYDLSGGIRVSDMEFEALLGRPIPPGERKPGTAHTINSTFSDIKDKWLGRMLLALFSRQINKLAKDRPEMKPLFEKMIMDAPLRILIMSAGENFSTARVEGLVELLNGHLIQGCKAFLKKSPYSGNKQIINLLIASFICPPLIGW